MMKNVLLTLVVLFVTSCISEGDEPDSDSLKKAVNTFNKAFEQADTEKLSAMITENYVHTNSSWKAFGKEEWLGYMSKRSERIKNGALVINSYQMSEMQLTLHGKSALVTGKITVEGAEEGEFFKSEIRVSNYWVYTDTGWKRAGFHDTRIENKEGA